MYKKPNKLLWTGRIDEEDKEQGKRWHEKIKSLPYPYKKEGGIALLGFDCDEGIKRNKGRAGAAEACDVLKKSMCNFAYHLENMKLYDAGKIEATSNLDESQIVLASHISTLLTNKHFPIVLGGGHEVAYASFLGLFNTINQDESTAIINFDAHFDLRINAEATSGTPFTQIAALCEKNNAPFNYMCLGVSKSSNTKALFQKAKDLKVKYILDTKMSYANFKKIKNKLDVFLTKKEHIYISIDADVFSAYNVPAVSAPAARGIELNLTYEVLEYIFNKYRNKIRLIDFAEFSPTYDVNDIGKKAIARLIYDVVQFVDENI